MGVSLFPLCLIVGGEQPMGANSVMESRAGALGALCSLPWEVGGHIAWLPHDDKVFGFSWRQSGAPGAC